jgi:L-arabinokinase
MGGFADYSGSLVLEMPIAEATFAAIQKNSSRTVQIVSINHDGEEFSTFEVHLADLMRDAKPLDLASARNYFAERTGGDWASYVGGIFFVRNPKLDLIWVQDSRRFASTHRKRREFISSSRGLGNARRLFGVRD